MNKMKIDNMRRKKIKTNCITLNLEFNLQRILAAGANQHEAASVRGIFRESNFKLQHVRE